MFIQKVTQTTLHYEILSPFLDTIWLDSEWESIQIFVVLQGLIVSEVCRQ